MRKKISWPDKPGLASTTSRLSHPGSYQFICLDNGRYNEYCREVSRTIEEKTSRRRFGCLEEDVFVSMHRTADLLARNAEKVLRDGDVSPNQYNVLRILRGSPEGLPCTEIARRMISRDPDITRLLDRLEKRSLISRCREAKDRRTVLTRITPDGLQLLRNLDGPITEVHKSQLGHLGREGLRSLLDLLEKACEKVA
jgi:DNA-binding MarR family transcriptional regulator